MPGEDREKTQAREHAPMRQDTPAEANALAHEIKQAAAHTHAREKRQPQAQAEAAQREAACFSPSAPSWAVPAPLPIPSTPGTPPSVRRTSLRHRYAAHSGCNRIAAWHL